MIGRAARAGFLAALMVVGILSTAPATAAVTPLAGKTCTSTAAGLIGDRWRALGGMDGPLGCPVGGEQAVPGRSGRIQTFEHGQVAWTPSQGTNATVALYARGNQTTLDWGSTLPFTYSFFIVRWDLDGRNVGQKDVANVGQAGPGGVRDRGSFTTTHGRPGRYTFVVEGCDGRFLDNSVCRQGWTIPLSVAVPQAVPAPAPMPKLPPPRPATPGPFDMERAEFTNCTPERRPLTFWVTDEATGRTDRLGPLAAQYDENGRCPAGGDPLDVNFADGHTYTIVAVDPQAIGCGADDPRIQACQKKIYIFRGRAGAGTKTWSVP
ncbi:LGFP repeat-containing protein [Pseudonocardia sp. CA-107938]|uniref:LGFP repeat-containing protein n=1 Tax=Pseudonocardia sp. CA-107938 TaxID=3240021 RepID=UPI003D9370F1